MNIVQRSDNMIVYHGSDTVVDRPAILKAKRPLDFGRRKMARFHLCKQTNEMYGGL